MNRVNSLTNLVRAFGVRAVWPSGIHIMYITHPSYLPEDREESKLDREESKLEREESKREREENNRERKSDKARLEVLEGAGVNIPSVSCN